MLAKNHISDRVAQAVCDTISDLLEEQELENPGLDDDAKLVDTLGLKSMDTVGDLINAYRVTLDPGLVSDVAVDTAANTPASAGVARRANRRR